MHNNYFKSKAYFSFFFKVYEHILLMVFNELSTMFRLYRVSFNGA